MKINLHLSKYVLFISVLISTPSICQELQDLSILIADEAYGKEIIKLPVDWAPEMTLEGFEELRFAPGWSNVESPEFWTYVLAWDIKTNNPLSSSEIEANLEYYFDGLMKPNYWATSFPEPLVLLTSSDETKTTDSFKGKMKYFDGLHTGKMMSTYILAEQTFCKETNRAIVVFRISPHEFQHEVWGDLSAIKKEPNICDPSKNE